MVTPLFRLLEGCEAEEPQHRVENKVVLVPASPDSKKVQSCGFLDQVNPHNLSARIQALVRQCLLDLFTGSTSTPQVTSILRILRTVIPTTCHTTRIQQTLVSMSVNTYPHRRHQAAHYTPNSPRYHTRRQCLLEE